MRLNEVKITGSVDYVPFEDSRVARVGKWLVMAVAGVLALTSCSHGPSQRAVKNVAQCVARLEKDGYRPCEDVDGEVSGRLTRCAGKEFSSSEIRESLALVCDLD